ncbi:hypothetical protein OC834_007260 [Tilletia horrida]|nr:hypothetical protein OC834_007260 [Tilletia horrida]
MSGTSASTRGKATKAKGPRTGAAKGSSTSAGRALTRIEEESGSPSGSGAGADVGASGSSTQLTGAASGAGGPNPGGTGNEQLGGGGAGGGEQQAGPQRAARRTTQQVVDDRVAEAEKRMSEKLEEYKTEVDQLTADAVKEQLAAYTEAVETFAVEERLVTLEDGMPSRIDEGKIVIVLNAIQLDELREALRAHRSRATEVKKLETLMEDLQERLTALELRTPAESSRRTRRAREDTASTELDDEDDPERTLVNAALHTSSKPARKRAKQAIGRGRPDAAAQRAFEELLREAMGISKEDDWPAYPSVPRDSDEWPRHPPAGDNELPADHPEAHLDPALRTEPPARGEPKLRLDWCKGRIDDEAFNSIVVQYAAKIVEDADDFELPEAPEMRTEKRVRAACKRTLEHIKRTTRIQLQSDAAALEAKKQQKIVSDRRRVRRATRTKQRKAAAASSKTNNLKSIVDLLSFECVEEDETEGEGEAVEEGQKKVKVVKQVIPEWWSTENRRVQRELDAAVPYSSSGHTLKAAEWLTPATKKLSARIPRIAVSSAFAEKYPELVSDLKKNPPPYTPTPGAIAADASSYGRPIRGLTLQHAAGQHDDDDDDDIDLVGMGGRGGPSGTSGKGKERARDDDEEEEEDDEEDGDYGLDD